MHICTVFTIHDKHLRILESSGHSKVTARKTLGTLNWYFFMAQGFKFIFKFVIQGMEPVKLAFLADVQTFYDVIDTFLYYNELEL